MSESVAKRILLIEDNTNTAAMLVDHIEEYGYECEIAYNGEEGLALLAEKPFDLVLVDFVLPGKNGVRIIEDIRSLGNINPGIIVLTGVDDVRIAVTAMKSGADDFLIKDTDELFFDLLLPSVIQQILGKKDLENEKARIQAERETLVEDLEAFGYAIIHDLKQPLSILQMSTNLMRKYQEHGMHDKHANQLARIDTTVERMASILDGLVIFAQTRHQRNVPLEPLDMTTIVESVLDSLATEIDQQNVEIHYSQLSSNALGYPQWVEQVWLNYLVNAIKYGGTPPCIHVGSTVQDNGTIKFWVRDNGIGIPQSKVGSLFLPFSRIQQIKAQGHGLGLSIVNQIVQKLGGDVGVTGNEDGIGSCFFFTLRQNIE